MQEAEWRMFLPDRNVVRPGLVGLQLSTSACADVAYVCLCWLSCVCVGFVAESYTCRFRPRQTFAEHMSHPVYDGHAQQSSELALRLDVLDALPSVVLPHNLFQSVHRVRLQGG